MRVITLRILAVSFLSGVLFVGCVGNDDEMATFEVIICEHDADCEDGRCFVDEEEVETLPIFARAIESKEASRFGDEGLFVLSTWQIDERWIELEFDVPTNWIGYVDLHIRYDELVDGVLVYHAEDVRGRIVLIEGTQGELPYAAEIELRTEAIDGEVRRLHQGFLDPGDDWDITDPELDHDPIDWTMEGVQLLIVSAENESSGGYDPALPPLPDIEIIYAYDYRDESYDMDIWFEEWAEPESDQGCSSTDDGSAEYGGDSYYVEESGGCSGDDSYEYDASGCSGDDYYEYEDAYSEDDVSGCDGGYDDSEGSLCMGDSDDDVWEDDSDYGSDCDSYYYEDDYYDSSSSCEGDDWSGDESYDCDGGGTTESSSSCDGDTYVASRSRSRRQALRAHARGRPSPPVRRALGFFPVVVGFGFQRLLGRRAPLLNA